ncbi:helix-turn-helix domain-containing protein [Streptomyces sp. NPDC096152]|uniref:helix-turn-helix domain-containing protein n=1 Tax=Streptomyces sp. NPDC096152 TaxID=3366078 RepID=UPI00380AD847
MLAFGYLILGRSIEGADLQIEDLTIQDDRILVWLPEDKTHKDDEQTIPLRDRPDVQLVARMRRWLGYLAEQGITTGPAFRHLLKNGKPATEETRARTATKRGVHLRGHVINERVKHWSAAAGLVSDGRPVTSHGLRAGGATDLAKHGATEEQLERAGRWRPGSRIPAPCTSVPPRPRGTTRSRRSPYTNPRSRRCSDSHGLVQRDFMRTPLTSQARKGRSQSPASQTGVPFPVDARNGASMPQWSDYTTGERIKILRGREIRQADLAELTGLSIVTIQKAEQDKALSLPTLLAIADALGVDTSVILGQQAPRRALEQGDRIMIRDLSRAVHDTAVGLLPVDAEPAPADDLEQTTARCWDLYWKGRYIEAGAVIAPFLVAAAAHLHEQPDGEQAPAWGLLSDAYRLAGYVANLMGARDLAYSAIGHAQNAAERAADDMRVALVGSGRSWVYLRDARLPEALKLAEKSAADIEPRFSTATPEELTAYGSHVNFAAVVASRMGDKDRAADFLSQSHATGARMGREVRAHGTLFGPVSATTQAVGVNVALGQTGKAWPSSTPSTTSRR